MRCWVDRDEFYPYFRVWTADPPSYVETTDIPLKVIREYEKAQVAFLKAHVALREAYDVHRWSADRKGDGDA